MPRPRYVACLTIAVLACAQIGWAQRSDANTETDARDDLGAWIEQLGSEEYVLRDQATRNILLLGSSAIPQLRDEFDTHRDPEIRHRLRYLLEHLVPPERAVLVIRADPDSGIRPGDLITHVNATRIESIEQLQRRLNTNNTPLGAMLSITGRSGPREIGPISFFQLETLLEYVATPGETIARAVRLYADGFAELAYDALRSMSDTVSPRELPAPLLARIAYAAGDASTALSVLEPLADTVRPQRDEWSSPSELDLSAPGKAPFHLEWRLFSQGPTPRYSSNVDPDLRVQRVLVPARRFGSALLRAAELWSTTFKHKVGPQPDETRTAGNQLAVIGWMLSELGLRSECCRVIEPRSEILRSSHGGIRKWIRVETDAWLPFFAAAERAALDGFYDDAMSVLQRPPEPTALNARIRNPSVAARLAFFLYQFPNDPRVGEALRIVNVASHPVLTEYLDWMLFALDAGNNTEVRRDLQSVLPQLSDEQALRYARAVALLEYVQDEPDSDVMLAARQRVFDASRGVERDHWLALIDALGMLTRGRPDDALAILAPFEGQSESAALRQTAAFLSNPPAAAGNHAALQSARLIVPIGNDETQWLVLSDDRRILHFDAQQNLLTAAQGLSRGWFPNPLTWPWIGRETSSGRVWIYDRRRVIEIGDDERALSLNLQTRDIPAFDRHVGPFFSHLAEAIADVAISPGENGEFLRKEIHTHHDLTADPDLPDVSVIEALTRDPRVVHVGLRGGPQLLVDTTTGKAWTSVWLREQLGLDRTPTFFPQALWPTPGPEGAVGAPVVMLMSDQGLIRFDLDTETVARIALPGEESFPSLIPESAPYDRRDPRFVYVARLPADGGEVFRIQTADETIEATDLINEALPEHYYDLRTRSRIRREIDRMLTEAGMFGLQDLIDDAAEVVDTWKRNR